jgi:UDP-N-acetylglucosamine 2-epimerase (non-hydrolysing)
MKIIHIVGARPNFMKAAPAIAALKSRGIKQTIVHTGQHYDANMSEIFFQQLGLPKPDVNLEVGSGSHTAQTANVMIRFEETVLMEKPDLVMVYGDVNSTVAAALVCAKMGIRIAHVEAGLRSRDRSMPEEINRLVVDQLADLLFTPSRDGDENLKREGVALEKIHFVGNLMIDTLVRQLPHAKKPDFEPARRKYILVTLHRPSNVDEPAMLETIIKTLAEVSNGIPVIFPIHPRTRQRLASINYQPSSLNLHLTDPVGYLEFLALQRDATAVITDSGGIQEETTYLGVPCLTVRENTERPITVEVGTNILVGQDMCRLKTELSAILAGHGKKGQIPPLWDGKAGERVAGIISELR